MKKTLVLFFFSSFNAFNLSAQAPYFSQSYSSPQFLNTASIGGDNYEQKIYGNFRTQFINNTNAYQTIYAGWDRSILFNNNDNKLGVGVNILSDQLMGGALNTNYLSVGLAYHIFIDKLKYDNLSLGLGLTYTSNTIDKSKITFADQYDASANIINGISAESFKNNSSHFTMNTGLVYTRHNEKLFVQTGAAVFFQTRPDLLNTTTSSSIGTKFVLHANLETLFLENLTTVLHTSFIRANNYNQILTGGAIGLPISRMDESRKRIYLGCFYRIGDAVIPMTKLMTEKYTLGFTYDIYNSNLTQAVLRQNTFELSFTSSFGFKQSGLLRTLFD